MQCFQIFGGVIFPPGCAPGLNHRAAFISDLLHFQYANLRLTKPMFN